MASLFTEFSDTCNEFRKEFPTHPLNEELRAKILRGRYPSNQWLRNRTRRMKDLMEPIWIRAQRTRRTEDTVN